MVPRLLVYPVRFGIPYMYASIAQFVWDSRGLVWSAGGMSVGRVSFFVSQSLVMYPEFGLVPESGRVTLGLVWLTVCLDWYHMVLLSISRFGLDARVWFGILGFGLVSLDLVW